MAGEKNLDILLKTMKPKLHEGQYVFCEAHDIAKINLADIIMSFKEEESITMF